MKKQVATIATLLPLFLIILATRVSASEGTLELSNTEGGDTRCYGLSVLMPSLDYSVLMTCREITYPGDANQFNYVAWAQPSDNGGAIRLGTLGVGKVEFKVNEAFRQIFVTRETSSRPRTAEGPTVLRGNIQNIDFLDKPQPAEENETPQTTSSPTPTPTENTSLFSRLFKASSLIPFVGVVILLVLVFILTRR